VAGKTIKLVSSLPQITESLKVLNNNDKNVTVDGQGINGIRPFNIAEEATVTLKQLTITGGNVNAEVGGSLDGGGIVNQGGVLTLNTCIVTRNQNFSAGLTGGGIANVEFGTLTVKNSTVSNNSAVAGGGIRNDNGELHLLGTKIKGNRSQFGGGGIFSAGGSASAVITDCTIAGNVAGESGGGIVSLSGPFTIERSTVSGNRATLFGGGVILMSGDDTATLLNCTIAHNLADGGGGGIITAADTTNIVNCTIVGNADTGIDIRAAGGIVKSGGTVNVRNTIITLNSAGPDAADDNVDLPTLDENTNNFIGSDPRLGPLDLNGGPTQTMAPLDGSPLINAGDNASANNAGLTADQRGLSRIVDGTVDIGAVETQAGEPLPLQGPRERRPRERERPSLPAGAFDLDLAFAAAVLNQHRGAKREAAARFEVFAELGTQY
jgi:hypothetical protein